ncbi:MAG: two-component sensor histidine kinase [Myxococcales bacterium]|nr:two-component sensor histidine kinase [Myxococcales bacterium]
MSLRLRLFAIVLAATLVPIAPLAIALLLQVRDAIYARRIADARLRLDAAIASCGNDRACLERAGAAVAACTSPMRRNGEVAILCRDGVELREDLAPVRQQLAALDVRLLATLLVFMLLLVAIAVWLLDRGVVRRLGRIDAALEQVGAEQGGQQLLPEGGDAVGRVGAAVNRLAQRLREERARTREQIDELRAAREEVVRAERLASVGRLAAGVAHEVGNPVAALIGYASLMRERLAQGKDVAEYAGRVEREATRIDRILRDLLDLARPRPAPLETADLRRAVQLATETAPLAVETQLPELPRVRGEEHYISQVLVNLFTNAQRAGARQVRVGAQRDGSSVLVQVADDGAGIPPEVLPRLFEPFFTTAAPGQGTGLGLALCHATMERLGGSIAARNREDARGALFELRFPVSESSPPSSSRG